MNELTCELGDDYLFVMMLALIWQSPPVASFIRSDGRCAPGYIVLSSPLSDCRFALRHHAQVVGFALSSSLNLLLSLMFRLCLGIHLYASCKFYMRVVTFVSLSSIQHFAWLAQSRRKREHVVGRVHLFWRFPRSEKRGKSRTWWPFLRRWVVTTRPSVP